MTDRWRQAAIALALTVLAAIGGVRAETADTAEAIYRQGVLHSGKVLRGERIAGSGVEGIAAACITCHRSSGFGSTEGRTVIPPITGKYLFRPHSTNVNDLALPHLPGYRSTREPYTDATLAMAIREGLGPNGRQFSDLMPRYRLDDVQMGALVSYLKGLDLASVPGVTNDVLHFATIVTADADPLQRIAMLAVMERFFADKNSFIRGGARPMRATREIEYRVSRRWQLHVWQLTGPSEDWESQLRAHLAAEPIFAVISGLGRKSWEPVHRFCVAARLPCLMPNVDLPVVAEGDFYPVYFSRGVLLEADLMAAHLLREREARRIRRVVQVYRNADIGQSAANSLAQRLHASGFTVESRSLPADGSGRTYIKTALEGIGPTDALVLWLRPDDLAALPEEASRSASVVVSGTMGGMENAPLPARWHAVVSMTYPADLPELRRVRMNFPLGWFKIKRIDVVDERIQTDTYVACGILAETLNEMLDSFVPDYLVERIEAMLSHRLVNGYYPRLSLSQGQRFASKGGYVVRFLGPAGTGVAADGEWTVP